jgi:hypothetical protein
MRLVFAVISFVLFSGASQSIAGPVACSLHKDIVGLLDSRYHERLVSYGISANKRDKIEVYISAKGTFTVLATSPNGISCILAAGDNFEMGKVPKEMTAL